MRRTTIALVTVTAISCAVSLVLAIGWMNDRTTLRSLRAQLAAGAPTATPAAGAVSSTTPSPSATAASSSACASAPSASASAVSGPTPTRLQIKTVADSSGRVWVPYDSSNIKVGTTLCFTVRVVDPISEPLQYKFWLGDRPNETLVCDWGGPSCQLTATLPQGVNYTPYQIKFNIAVRTNASVHQAGNGACFQDDACDAVTWIQFTLS